MISYFKLHLLYDCYCNSLLHSLRCLDAENEQKTENTFNIFLTLLELPQLDEID